MRINEIYYLPKDPATVYLRLQGCSLRCKWVTGECDIPYVLDINLGLEVPLDQLVKKLEAYPCRRLVIIGGDPLVQQEEVAELINRLDGWEIELHTNGVLSISKKLAEALQKVKLIVTPKLSAAGNTGEFVRKEYREKAAAFKFLVEASGELGEIDRYIQYYKIDSSKVFLRARGLSISEQESKLPWLTRHAKVKGYTVIPRHPLV